jgi:hypothetical protein
MLVRYRLDECRIKLSLQDWQSLDLATRKRLIAEDVDPLGGKRRYRRLLVQAIVHQAKTRVVRMPASQEEMEWNRLRLPDRVRQNALDKALRLDGPRAWPELNALQRFTLFKLTRPGHRNRNFALAMREFGLCAQAVQTKPTATGASHTSVPPKERGGSTTADAPNTGASSTAAPI